MLVRLARRVIYLPVRLPAVSQRLRVPRIHAAAMGNQSVKSKDVVLEETPKPKVTFSEEQLRQRLSEEEYNITQNKGTERAWTGKYVNVKEDGTFLCIVCGIELFRTDKKFESGSGWPSFTDIVKRGNVNRIIDDSHGMVRTEVACGSCNAHLGHVFEDGPKEDTGLRYCINSASLKFDSSKKPKKAAVEETPVASKQQEETTEQVKATTEATETSEKQDDTVEGDQQQQDEPTGDQDEPTVEQDEPTGEQDEPTVEQDEPTGDQDKPTGDQDEPTGDQDEPTGDQDEPTVEQDEPTGDQDEPTGEQDEPTVEQDEPTGDQDKPTGDQDEPVGEQDKPQSEDK